MIIIKPGALPFGDRSLRFDACIPFRAHICTVWSPWDALPKHTWAVGFEPLPKKKACDERIGPCSVPWAKMATVTVLVLVTCISLKKCSKIRTKTIPDHRSGYNCKITPEIVPRPSRNHSNDVPGPKTTTNDEKPPKMVHLKKIPFWEAASSWASGREDKRLQDY